jgi:hypothetical protein
MNEKVGLPVVLHDNLSVHFIMLLYNPNKVIAITWVGMITMC